MRCAHLFVRRPGWWWKLHLPKWTRWICRECGMSTRTYDAADLWATRPIHPHMTVAFPGYNTTRDKAYAELLRVVSQMPLYSTRKKRNQ
jgi:hypothetical protein